MDNIIVHSSLAVFGTEYHMEESPCGGECNDPEGGGGDRCLHIGSPRIWSHVEG